MTQKIFRSILVVAITVLLLSLLFIVGVLYDYFGSAQKSRLNAELNLAAGGVEAGGTEYLENLDAEDFRMTLISSDGNVVFDSETDPEAMENHSQREEIIEALETGFGGKLKILSNAYGADILPCQAACKQQRFENIDQQNDRSRSDSGNAPPDTDYRCGGSCAFSCLCFEDV